LENPDSRDYKNHHPAAKASNNELRYCWCTDLLVPFSTDAVAERLRLRFKPFQLTIIMKITTLIALFLFPVAAALVSCKEKGPAEKAGESLDKAAENVSDAVNPKGPVEKAGEKIDKATGH
jgi:hypothetical protein